MLVFLCASVRVAYAEPLAFYADSGASGSLLAFAPPPSFSAGADWLPNAAGTHSLLDPLPRLSDSTFERDVFTVVPPEPPRTFDPSIRVLHMKIPSRYASGNCAGFHTGYGSVFGKDRVGRGWMNGAGYDDPKFFFFRVSYAY